MKARGSTGQWWAVGAVLFGVGAALFSSGVAHADEGSTSSKASSQRASSKQQTAKASTTANVSTARRGLARPGRPTGSSTPPGSSASPYTGRPPNHALEIGLIQLAGYLTMGIPTNGKPPGFLRAVGFNVTRSEVDGTPVYTLQSRGSTSEKEIIALHGGGYVNEIGAIQWISYAVMARNTGAAVVVPIYPLAPTGTASVVVPQMAGIITRAVAERGADNVSVLGDSAGGGLALAAVQELVRTGAATPGRIVLVSPWLDATISDPESEAINEPGIPKDVMRSYGLQWAGELDPDDPLVSPINGSLDGLPPTYIYAGSRDYFSPQTLRLREQAIAQGLDNFTFVLRNGEIHAWANYPFLPSAIADRAAIERQLLGK